MSQLNQEYVSENFESICDTIIRDDWDAFVGIVSDEEFDPNIVGEVRRRLMKEFENLIIILMI